MINLDKELEKWHRDIDEMFENISIEDGQALTLNYVGRAVSPCCKGSVYEKWMEEGVLVAHCFRCKQPIKIAGLLINYERWNSDNNE